MRAELKQSIQATSNSPVQTRREFKERHRLALQSESIITRNPISVKKTLKRTVFASVIASIATSVFLSFVPRMVMEKEINIGLEDRARRELAARMAVTSQQIAEEYPLTLAHTRYGDQYADTVKVEYDVTIEEKTISEQNEKEVVRLARECGSRIKEKLLEAGTYMEGGYRISYSVETSGSPENAKYVTNVLRKRYDAIMTTSFYQRWRFADSWYRADGSINDPRILPGGEKNIVKILARGECLSELVNISSMILFVPFPWLARERRRRPWLALKEDIKKMRKWFRGEKMRSKEELKPIIEEYKEKYAKLLDKMDEAKTKEEAETIMGEDRLLDNELGEKITKAEWEAYIPEELGSLARAFKQSYLAITHPKWKI